MRHVGLNDMLPRIPDEVDEQLGAWELGCAAGSNCRLYVPVEGLRFLAHIVHPGDCFLTIAAHGRKRLQRCR